MSRKEKMQFAALAVWWAVFWLAVFAIVYLALT